MIPQTTHIRVFIKNIPAYVLTVGRKSSPGYGMQYMKSVLKMKVAIY